MFLLKCLTGAVIAVITADIIVKRALDRAEKITRDAVDHALNRIERETGLPLNRRNRRPWLNHLLAWGRKKEVRQDERPNSLA